MPFRTGNANSKRHFFKQIRRAVISMFFLFCCIFNQALLSQAQQVIATNTNAVVPPLVNFSGTLTEPNGRPLTGTVAVTFSLYSEQTGGAALWMETQSVQPDLQGHYTVMLGSTSSNGLPADIFVAGQAHWLGVQVQGQEEQPRVLLVSAPYALKAGDAQTVGGLPASAFALAAPGSHSNTEAVVSATGSPATANASVPPPASSDVTTTGGTANTIPLFTTSTNIQNSILSQTGTTTVNIAGKLNLPATGVASSTAGSNSRAQVFVASAYNSSTSAAVNQTFQWQAQPVGNDTATPSGSLNLLYGSGTSTPAQTGLHIASSGQITFAAGQKFPGTGTGTITGVTAGADLTGGGTSGKVTLNLDTTKVPLLAANNTFTSEQIINAGGITPGLSVTSGGGIYSVGNGVGVTGSTTVGGLLAAGVKGMDNSTSGNAAGVYGFSSAGYGVYGGSESGYGVVGGGGITGVWGSSSGGSGVSGTTTSGQGVSGTVSGTGVAMYGLMQGTAGEGVWGETNGTSFFNGVGSDGVHGVAHSNAGSGVAGVNDATNGTGVYGSDTQGYGFVTDSHVSQGRSKGGWAKAMVYLDGPTTVTRCFNSQIAGSSASTVPCGITVTTGSSGGPTIVDFGFEIDDRFVMASFTSFGPVSYCLSSDGCSVTSSQVYLQDTSCVSGGDCFWTPVYIIVF